MNETGNMASISAKSVPLGPRVYFISDGAMIKIGFSELVWKRLTELQVGHPAKLKLLGTIRGDTEEELHRRFAHLKERGEWFHPEPELLQFIAENCERPAAPPELEPSPQLQSPIWLERAEEFVGKVREETRQGKLSSTARHAANYAGCFMHRLAYNDTPELRAELAKQLAAFEAARPST